jgi:drug/metabolite transporter (DMT)-like permease
LKNTVLTGLALMAFAGNSVLCRLALGEGLIDAAGFTSIRLLAGAIMLIFICLISLQRQKTEDTFYQPELIQLKGAVLLFVYAICFSYAYLILDTGTGALILFGSVQLTLITLTIINGKRPTVLECIGLALSFTGLLNLLMPTLGTPTLLGFVLMAISGISWALYTAAGQGSKNPMFETCKNFICCVPLVVVLNFFSFQPNLWTSQGVILAILSGAITSGIGYAIWYAVLPQLSALQAGVVQLLVPVVATLGGVVVLSEDFTARLLLALVLVTSGVLLVLKAKSQSLVKASDVRCDSTTK